MNGQPGSLIASVAIPVSVLVPMIVAKKVR
jgi:hypothetical protein